MEGAHPNLFYTAFRSPHPTTVDLIFVRCCSVHAGCHVLLNSGPLILAGGKLLILGTIRHLDSKRDLRYGGRELPPNKPNG